MNQKEPRLKLSPYPIWAAWDFNARPQFILYEYLGYSKERKIYCFRRRNEPDYPVVGRTDYQMQESFIYRDFLPFLINFDEIYPDPPELPPLPEGPPPNAAS